MSARSRCRIRASTSSRCSASRTQIIPTRITFVDIAGLVRGASKGEGLGNQFLATIREVDAIVHVVRCFEDDDVTHVEGKIDPIADIETIETELMLADLDSLEKRVDALEKKAKGTGEDAKAAKEMLDLINRALVLLREGKPARLVARKPEEEKLFHSLGLLTSAPVLYACNVEEASAATGNEFSRKVEARAKEEGAVAVVISAKIESEIATLPPAERAEFLEAVGPEGDRARPADPRRLRAAASGDLFHRRAEGDARLDHHAGHQGAAGGRRDPFAISSAASSAAETIAYDDFIACGGEAGARDAGKMRLEGKDYVVADGDVMHFRFAT